MEDSFSMDWGGGGSGSNASDGEQWGAAELALPLLTSCCMVWFLTGLGPGGPGVGDPWSTGADSAKTSCGLALVVPTPASLRDSEKVIGDSPWKLQMEN